MRKLLFVVLVLLTAAGNARGLNLPSIGDPSRAYLGLNDEQQLGLEIYQQIAGSGVMIQDPFLQEYIDSVGQKIATHAQRDGGRFTFFMINDSDINAFALPGGYIGVYTGLLLATRSEAELAGVLSHEAAHVTQLHIARRFAYESQMRLPSIAASLVGAVVASQAGGSGVPAALAAGSALSTQGQINFTRDNEYEADRVGTDYLVSAGFDPEGMPDFFERLARNSRMQSGSGVPEFLRTHPVETRRIAETRARIAKLGKKIGRSDSLEYHLAKARLVALTTPDPASQAQRFEQRLDQGKFRNRQSEEYGLAICLRRAGRLQQASDRIDALLEQHPESLPYLMEAAEIALRSGQGDRAKSQFQRAERLYPGDYSLAISYGDALVKSGQNRKAMKVLRPALRRDAGHAQGYALYARAALQNGMIADSHAHMAIFYDLYGQTELATRQIELGLQDPQLTPYQRSRMEAHLELLRARSEEQEKG